MSHCSTCDPKVATVYGFCKSCRRRCECPLYDPKSHMAIYDYEEYKRHWNMQRPDLFADVRQEYTEDMRGNVKEPA